MPSKEVTAKFKYTTGNTGTKTFSELLSSLDKTTAVANLKDYTKVVDGELTAATFKTVEDLDINA